MKKEDIQALFQNFEDAVCTIDDTECWSARDMQKLLGYSLWQNFTNVINKAKAACENVGQPISDHFIDVNKKVDLGSGAQREVDDVMLTRYACYLVAQPGDVPTTYADATALERDFGFTPKITLREGLRHFAEWYKEYYG